MQVNREDYFVPCVANTSTIILTDTCPGYGIYWCLMHYSHWIGGKGGGWGGGGGGGRKRGWGTEAMRRLGGRQDDRFQGRPAVGRESGAVKKIPPVHREGFETHTVIRGKGIGRRWGY